MSLRVICLGILVADVIVKAVTEFPQVGKLETVESISLSLGGCAANTGVGLARLGHETGVIGAVGDDGFGDFIVDALTDEGIDPTGIINLENVATSVTAVLVNPHGERSFLHFKGANALFTSGDLDMHSIELADHLHIGGTFLMDAFDGPDAASVLRAAKEAGLSTSLDTAWDPEARWFELLGPMLEYVDIFLPSEEEARMISGEDDVREMARFFFANGVKTVGIKRGREGGYFRKGDDDRFIAAAPVDVVDTTGCGDAFCAGFIDGFLEGLSLKDCGRRAVALGSLCATGIGAVSKLPRKSYFEEYIGNL
jgi:sugar/nucleoside kinase (ribokinase family)